MRKDERIFVAGGLGLVGGALRRLLSDHGFEQVLAPGHDELDLTDQAAVEDWFAIHKPDYVFMAAGRVGGILANRDYPVDYLLDNLRMYANVIEVAQRSCVQKFMFIGSSCVYPNSAPQPIPETALLSGPFEPSLQFFGAAKIAGIKLCQAYRQQYGFDAISLMPCSLYGPGDYFDLERAHVLPALMRKFHEAKVNRRGSVEIWGSGKPRREFLYVDDFARAAIFLMENYSDSDVINVGSGEDITILNLAGLIQDVVGFEGEISLDATKPDGVMQKLLDISRLRALGWQPEISLREGLESTYDWMRGHLDSMRA